MALQQLSLVEGNTGPDIQITCQRSGTAISLTDASSVSLTISRKGFQTNIGHTTCAITNAAEGIISYAPGTQTNEGQQPGDFPVAGNYFCDVNVVYTNGTDETLYDQLLITARPLSDSAS